MMEYGGPNRGIVVVAGRESDDEVREEDEKEKVEDEVKHVDRKAVGEPFLSEKSFAKRVAEMVGSTELHHHL